MVSLWAFLHFVVLQRTDRGGPQQRIGNISRPAAAETCPPGRTPVCPRMRAAFGMGVFMWKTSSRFLQKKKLTFNFRK